MLQPFVLLGQRMHLMVPLSCSNSQAPAQLSVTDMKVNVNA